MNPSEGEPQTIRSWCQKDAWWFNMHAEASIPHSNLLTSTCNWNTDFGRFN